MPWVRFTDDWYDDEDLIEAGPAAMLLWPLLISWSLRNLQDGKVPSRQVRRLVDWHELGIDPAQVIASLVEVGRLQEIAGGYQIVNFLKYQPSKEKVLADREASRDRAARSRDRRKGAEDVREPCADGAAAPDPVPVPDKSSSSSSSSDLDRLPPNLWTTMADKKVARAKITSNAKGYRSKCIENDKRDPELVARAVQIVEQYDVTTSYLADCLIGGTLPQPSYRKREDPAA